MRYVKIFFGILDGLMFLGILLYCYAWRVEPRWVKWEYVNMPVKNLPYSLINKTLIQISDIHIGENVNDEFIINNFKKINELKPDFVVYTGDFVSLTTERMIPFERLIKVLKSKAQGSLGTIAILGNHDYEARGHDTFVADFLERILVENNIIVLRNTAVQKNGLSFIGIDDLWGTNFNAMKAMKNYDPNIATIVLCHNPDVVDLREQWNNYQGWIICGHTHGGQVRLPFSKPFWVPVENENYDEGLKILSDNRYLYINRGLGHSIRMRFNVRPEITIFNLNKE